MNYSVVVLAAGSGTRANLGYNKLLYVMEDKTILEHTLAIFLADKRCVQIIVTHAASDADLVALMQGYPVQLVQGGKTRQESVYLALQHVTSEHVLIHDGARPYLAQADLDRLLVAVEAHQAAILGVPVKDTIKVVTDGIIDHTPHRASLWQAQTPQGFETELIQAAYADAIAHHKACTDDASVLETTRYVHMVEGSYENIKITTPDDLK
ncbi:MAG: 2-C-methyl-D-erythritol 4-phosphate cytidylyltransferase [Erysipelotrichaceae bacterium]